jgi:dihydropteroate synthase
MGVVNITPDSFSDGGRFIDPDAAIAQALRLLDEGADLLDLGAESTRPGSRVGSQAGSQAGLAPTVSADEEQWRLLPVLEGILKARPGSIISADTYKAATARAALAAGAEIINDVSGFSWDASLPAVCASAHCGAVLMHTRGRPDQWAAQSRLAAQEVIATVRAGLTASLDVATNAGIAADSIVLDPGYGFGKKFEENYALLARQSDLLALGRPLLAGVSRKLFLGRTLASLYNNHSAPVEFRETASVAAIVASVLHGASIVRVHTVRPAIEATRIADAILNEQ